MRVASFFLSSASLGLAFACRGSTSPDHPVVWGSDQASITVQRGSSRLLILNGQICYGYYGDIAQAIPSHAFDLSGTLTEIINVPPGQLQYPARFTGTVSGHQLTISVSVPSLQLAFGPFALAYGVNTARAQCQYP